MLNEYGKVINASEQTPTPDAKCKIKDIVLEYQIVTQLDLAKNISEEYQSIALLYERVIRHSTKPVDNSRTFETRVPKDRESFRNSGR